MQIYVVVIILLLVGGVVASYFAHRRKQEMIWLAEELELDYDARNILSGRYRGHKVAAGTTRVHSRSFALFQLDLPARLPVLTISPERRKLAVYSELDYADISFESNVFSRKFRVKSNDKKFAYDVCHPRMIEYLLAHPRLMIWIRSDKLNLLTSRLVPKTVKTNLDRLVEVRELLPDYLFSRR